MDNSREKSRELITEIKKHAGVVAAERSCPLDIATGPHLDDLRDSRIRLGKLARQLDEQGEDGDGEVSYAIQVELSRINPLAPHPVDNPRFGDKRGDISDLVLNGTLFETEQN